VLAGANGISGEWGHNPLPWMEAGEYPGPACYCGRNGCIERFVSGPALSAAHEAARRERALLIDGAVTGGGFNLALADLLARAGPYGAGNPEPMLALPSQTIAYADPVGENHIRVRLKAGDGKFVNAIAFRAVGTPLGKVLLDNRGRAVHAAGNLAIDRWQGEERVQLRLADIAATDV